MIAGLVASTAVACGGDDDEGGDDNVTTVVVPTAAATVSGEPTEATPEPNAPTAEGTGESDEASEVVAQAQDFSFTLDVVSVAGGSNVAVDFTNRGAAPHTLTFYIDEGFERLLPGADSGTTAPGETSAFQFQAPARGSMYYRCEVHPGQMQGELPVE
jgi:plastocyanin